MSNLSPLFVADTFVRQDSDGRYCVNDLHKAAGGEKRHQPSNWLGIRQTQELVGLLTAPGISGTAAGIPASAAMAEQNQPVIVLQGGNGPQGTFIVKELVYAYAMWISPAFHLRVIRTFDEVSSKPPAQEFPQLPPRPLIPAEIAYETAKAELALADLFNVPRSFAIQEIAKIVSAQSGIDHSKMLTQAQGMDNIPIGDVMLEPTELGKLFDLSGRKMNLLLEALGLQVRVAGIWTPTEKGESLCSKHAWVKGPKAGYNLKWRAGEIEKMVRIDDKA